MLTPRRAEMHHSETQAPPGPAGSWYQRGFVSTSTTGPGDDSYDYRVTPMLRRFGALLGRAAVPA
ncbi:hypothetical protein LNQ03_03315 [Klebsiella pneumoniae subsp. pneumoniae]|nr:hypothetical protein [Klebsiella pneumoniae subsp. pneumoniae]